MAIKYSTQYDNAYNNGVKVGDGDINGRKKSMFAEFDLNGSAIATTDTVKMCTLPAGARVTEVTILTPTWGGAGSVDVGTAADADAYFAAITGVAQLNRMTDVITHAGIYSLTTVETEVLLTATVNTTATAGIVKVQIDYVLV